MENEDDQRSNWLELLTKSKEIMMGIVVILSLIGAAYGSFKPESDARAGYGKLAPEILENAGDIAEMSERITYLEGQLSAMLHQQSCIHSPIPEPSQSAGHEPSSRRREEKEETEENLRPKNRKRREPDLTPPWDEQQILK